MNNSTTNTYKMKRKIINLSKKITSNSTKAESKFITDMIYGITKSSSVLVSDISDALMENNQKITTEKRLCNNLRKTLSENAKDNYLSIVTKELGDSPIILVDDSDIIKPCGNKFENLGKVRDGSSPKKEYHKGYMITEMVGLTKDTKHPISLFSHIHSSTEKNYISTNEITYRGLDNIINSIDNKATFIFDRGYDMNSLFDFMYNKKQNFIIRLKENRKIFHKNKWYKATTLRDSRKGKIKTTVMFQGEKRDCYVSHLNVEITASKNQMCLVMVYGLGKIPMMLATNCLINSKEDVIKVLRLYMSRWRIEEYFRFKKQEFGFENFRVRNLKAINNLNTLLTYVIAMIGMLAEKTNKNSFTDNIIKSSNSFKDRLQFYYYQIKRGIINILRYAKSGIKEWQNIRKTNKYRQFNIFDYYNIKKVG